MLKGQGQGKTVFKRGDGAGCGHDEGEDSEGGHDGVVRLPHESLDGAGACVLVVGERNDHKIEAYQRLQLQG